MENGKVIALLIDAENVSPKYIKVILSEVSMYGTPAYKRIYGDWTTNEMSSWKKVLSEHNIQPIQQFATRRARTRRTPRSSSTRWTSCTPKMWTASAS